MAKRGRGHPSPYKTEYAEQAFRLCLMGMTDAELGVFFNVTETTINNWKIEHPDFFESIKSGKDDADTKVTQSLYNRAIGYEHPEDEIMQYQGEPLIVPTIKHYPPEVTACIFWLKNRQTKKWRDIKQVEAQISGDMNYGVIVLPQKLPAGAPCVVEEESEYEKIGRQRKELEDYEEKNKVQPCGEKYGLPNLGH